MLNIKKLLLLPIVAIACMFTRIDSVHAAVVQGVTYPFSVTISNAIGINYGNVHNRWFFFAIGAQGTIYVDCGTDGTLIAYDNTNDVSGGTTLTKTATGLKTYACEYPVETSFPKTIQFGGAATSYASYAIVFDPAGWGDSVYKKMDSLFGDIDIVTSFITAISGDITAVFPYIGSGTLPYPAFYRTFSRTSITEIPENLFSFGGNNVPGGDSMFYGTFMGCTGLTEIPENLFKRVISAGQYMFAATFQACSNITGYIPPSTFAGLIANGHPTANYMWQNTFYNTQLVTSCPTGTSQYTTGYEGSDTSKYKKWNGKVSCIEPLAVTYSCGTGSGNSPSSTTATYNASFTPAANTCTPPSGQGFTGWLIGGTGITVSSAFTWNYIENKTLTAQYAPIVNLTWYDNNTTISGPASCAVGGTFLPPTPPARPGYIFAGWKAHVPPNTCGLENNTAARYGWDAYASVAIDGESCFWRDWDTLDESEWCEGEVFDGMAPGTWWDSNSVGTIYGEALCSSTSGQNCKSGTPDTNSTGGNCWCRSVSYKPNGGDLCVFAPTPSWIFTASWGSSCSSLCAKWCSTRGVNTESGNCRDITWDAIVQ